MSSMTGLDSTPLCTALRSTLPATARAYLTLPALEEHLEALWRRAAAEAPGLPVSAEEWLSWLGARLPPTSDPEEALTALFAGDLLLALGCARGLPAALSRVDTQLFPQLRAAVVRAAGSEALADDALQLLRVRLFTGPSPRIGEYSGQGPLLAFLRTAAVRLALNERRPGARLEQGDAALEEEIAPGDDLELQLLKGQIGRTSGRPSPRRSPRSRCGSAPCCGSTQWRG